jgi:superfamily I DNA/RNA helicase
VEENTGPLLLITFTNKAAEEIRQRLKAKPGQKTVRVETFHSFCLHWLRRHDPQCVLAGPEMREHLLRRCYPEHSQRERQEIRRQLALFLANQVTLPAAEAGVLEPYFSALRQAQLMDLDEIVPSCVALFQRDAQLAAAVQAEVAHLLVDEFQDLNAAQYALVHFLGARSSLFAIGDPDQAIYGFRGAKPIWFHKFIAEQQPERHVLRHNYRSGAQILAAAAALIQHNHHGEGQGPSPQAATSKQGRIYRHLAAQERAEARWIAEQIQHLIGGSSHREIERLRGTEEAPLALSEIAILCRTAGQMPVLAAALAERTLPCQVLDLEPFYLSGPARMLYYGLVLALGQPDPAELLLLLAQEEGMDSQDLALAEQVLSQTPGPALSVLAAASLPAPLQQSLAALRALADQLALLSPLAACELLRQRYQLAAEEPDVLRFRNLAAAALSLPAFVAHLRKHQNSPIYDERAEAVLLATLHAVKGLEFQAVFIAGCEEGLLPLSSRAGLSAQEEEEHIQEERRLFFVGLTRAAEHLYLCAAQERQRFAASHRPALSRFLHEIPEQMLSPLDLRVPTRKRAGRQLQLF